jgi:hypothetical protein
MPALTLLRSPTIRRMMSADPAKAVPQPRSRNVREIPDLSPARRLPFRRAEKLGSFSCLCKGQVTV